MAAQIPQALAEKLSPDASIHVQDGAGCSTATARWSQYKPPNIAIAVQVATEDDVAETVKYANQNNIPFLAYSGGHGAVAGLEQIRDGILINLTNLNSVVISEKGDTAVFGGGVLSMQVSHELWKAGKQTGRQAHGLFPPIQEIFDNLTDINQQSSGDAKSLLGPGLGGGHGFFQGKYGLISDQFVSMRIVLADGSIKHVSADDDDGDDPDLWCALQGAGHNFGIVTSVECKIYDVLPDEKWCYEMFVFAHDKVEALYEQINNLWPDGSQPAYVINYSVYLRNPDVDAEKPVIVFFIVRHNQDAVEDISAQPFRDLGPVFHQTGSGTLLDLPKWTGLDAEGPACPKRGLSMIRFPVNVQNYNHAAQREVFDTFATVTAETPEFENSFFMFEGYSLQAVKAVPGDSTAFPHRDDNIIIVPVVVYANATANPDLDARAVAFGEKLRQIIWSASGQKELHAYVNYASGHEGRESWYGYEPWRLQKLAGLKEKYDPEGRFKFYASVA